MEMNADQQKAFRALLHAYGAACQELGQSRGDEYSGAAVRSRFAFTAVFDYVNANSAQFKFRDTLIDDMDNAIEKLRLAINELDEKGT
jgi:hypothetical protein